jgi:hypothetical protein
MSDSQDILLISKMTVFELLCFVMQNPDMLTDPYYREWGRAIEKRYIELKETQPA